ncbi:uncharacterized protein LOC121381659 [Gigantopelta aegis]|uniref:uncharacterized protein LOC121381659 n=1 Tax=Gigantopelta aegis TaxID=1735272 RepID=UPI001B88810E|nr:uncharacterized protein LOC121381659 [Gigantopelta aegis]
MSPSFGDTKTEENKLNPFHFSKCSVAEITEFLTNISQTQSGLACLQNQIVQDKSVVDIRGDMPGQLNQPDELCKQYFGDESYMCRGPNFPIQEICRSLFCSKPGDSQRCVQVNSVRGTSCGNKKVGTPNFVKTYLNA